MIPLTYEEIWNNPTPKNYKESLDDATEAITALWQKQKKGFLGAFSFPNGWYLDKETLLILGAASAVMDRFEGKMGWIITRAYKLNPDKPYTPKIISLLQHGRAATKIQINFRQADVGKYYISGGCEFKKIPVNKITGRELTEWVSAYLKLCETRSIEYEQLLKEYSEMAQITR